MHARRPMFLLLLVAAALMVAGCGGGGADSGGDVGGDPGPDPAGEMSDTSSGGGSEGETIELGLEGSKFRFDKTELEAPAGRVTLRFTNSTSVPHNVAIETEDGKTLDAGEIIGEGEVSEATAELEPGTYRFVCTPHESVGMVGTLKVT